MSMEALFLTCIIDAMEGWCVATCDVPGAFMQTDINEHYMYAWMVIWLCCSLKWIQPINSMLFTNERNLSSTRNSTRLYRILRTIVPPECTHSQRGGGVQYYVKKIKLLKIRFPIPSKNVLIVHIEKKIENS